MYRFVDMSFKINGFMPEPVSELNDFRCAHTVLRNNYNIDVDIVDELPHINGEIVYCDCTGISIMLWNNMEYRIFRSLLTKERYAVLEETPEMRLTKRKKIYLARNYVDTYSINDRTFLNCLALEKTLIENRKLILHASFIETSKGAILFTAPSGVGKSTQAELWKKYKGSEIVNGDRVVIWRVKDMWYAGGVPWCGTSGITKNKIVPLNAVVLLEQGIENVITEPILIIKLKKMIEQTTINPWNKNMNLEAQNILLELCDKIAIYHFSCKPNKEAVDMLADKLGVY